ncbi:hypothetical protein AB8A20_11930 [Tardiphaga sp. 604_B6_N1_1]|uniref:hypothetical protein n=1 Tax=unclassified Tardiphaga TaxID=2631404 RepID=UPI003F213F15
MAIAGALSTIVPISIAAAPVEQKEDNASPEFGFLLPEGYRNWQVINVAHEAGNNNDIRAILTAGARGSLLFVAVVEERREGQGRISHAGERHPTLPAH